MGDLLPAHLSIFARLDAALVEGMAGGLFDGKVPDGLEVPFIPGSGGRVKPHACLWLGDDDEHPSGMGICGPQDYLGIMPITVLCVAADYVTLTQVRDIVKRSLVGFAPPDCGVIRMNGGLADQPVASLLKPQRYMRTLGFWMTTNVAGALV